MEKHPHPFRLYFHDNIEYPEPCDSMLPVGVLYEYISTTFLNGWINYVSVKCIRLISRYTSFEENQQEAQALIRSTEHHTNLSKSLSDDVFVLARGGEHWWFLWFDRDSSDSCIGRFETTDPEEKVLAAFSDYADDRSKHMGYEHSGSPAIAIPVSCLRGWING